jgi:hypothetical protein
MCLRPIQLCPIKNARSHRERFAARKEWEEANPGRLEEGKERIVKEIQQMVEAFTVNEIENACQCSLLYASLIKKGERVSHPAFYDYFERLIYQ